MSRRSAAALSRWRRDRTTAREPRPARRHRAADRRRHEPAPRAGPPARPCGAGGHAHRPAAGGDPGCHPDRAHLRRAAGPGLRGHADRVRADRPAQRPDHGRRGSSTGWSPTRSAAAGRPRRPGPPGRRSSWSPTTSSSAGRSAGAAAGPPGRSGSSGGSVGPSSAPRRRASDGRRRPPAGTDRRRRRPASLGARPRGDEEDRQSAPRATAPARGRSRLECRREHPRLAQPALEPDPEPAPAGVIPDWGSLIGLLPLVLLALAARPLLTLLALVWFVYMVRKPRGKLTVVEGPHAAPLDEAGQPVYPTGEPYCARDGLIYPSGATTARPAARRARRDLPEVRHRPPGADRHVRQLRADPQDRQARRAVRALQPAGPPPGGAAAA